MGYTKKQRNELELHRIEHAAFHGGVLYLNDSGDKWIIPGSRIRVIGTVNGKVYNKIRIPEYYSSFGNFATVTVKVNGKKVMGLMEERDSDGNGILRINL